MEKKLIVERTTITPSPQKNMHNHFLYSQKTIAAYFVIIIHCMFPGYLGIGSDSLARFAVPLFFTITGYFCFEKNIQQIYKSIKKTIKITYTACTVYFIWFVIKAIPDISLVKSTVISWFSIKSIIKFFLFNVPPSGFRTHLWYLFALIYCYIIFIIITKLKLIKLSYVGIPILLLVHLFLREEILIMGQMVPNFVTRNFALTGLPFFLLGIFIKNKNEHIKAINISQKYLCIGVVLGSILTLIERFVFLKNPHDLYAGSIIIVVFLMIYAIKYPQKLENSKIEEIGIKHSLFIYLAHPIFIDITRKIFAVLNLNDISALDYLLPVFVCILTTLGAELFYKGLSKLKKNS